MNYTPTTKEVRDYYLYPFIRNHDSYMTGVSTEAKMEQHRVEFDRWLAALIREAKAEALEEASLAYGSGQLSGIFLGRDDYPKAWLQARAAEYREGSET